jgi:hypothetical protein
VPTSPRRGTDPPDSGNGCGGPRNRSIGFAERIDPMSGTDRSDARNGSIRCAERIDPMRGADRSDARNGSIRCAGWSKPIAGVVRSDVCCGSIRSSERIDPMRGRIDPMRGTDRSDARNGSIRCAGWIDPMRGVVGSDRGGGRYLSRGWSDQMSLVGGSDPRYGSIGSSNPYRSNRRTAETARRDGAPCPLLASAVPFSCAVHEVQVQAGQADAGQVQDRVQGKEGAGDARGGGQGLSARCGGERGGGVEEHLGEVLVTIGNWQGLTPFALWGRFW